MLTLSAPSRDAIGRNRGNSNLFRCNRRVKLDADHFAFHHMDASPLFVIAAPMYNLSWQESSTTYSRTLDSTAFWNRLIEHMFVLAFFAWLSAGFLARKEFRVDLTEAHLMEVFENLSCLPY